MIESAKTWATQYRIDSFRFDLMGHQPRAVMEQLQQEVNAAGLVLGREIGMVAASGPSGIREDQDAFGPVHEGLGFCDVGARRTGLQLLTTIAADDEPACPASHFRHLIDAEAFDDGIKRGRDRRQGAELLDHPVARGEC